MNINREGIQEVDIIAFGPHPDDVEFGCGGFLAKMSKKYKVGIVDLTQAELSTNGNVNERMIEADIAGKILGATFRLNLKWPNNFIYNSKQFHDDIVRILRMYKPKMVLFPHDFDRHPDHENVQKIIRDAIFTSGLIKYEMDALPPHRPKYAFAYAMWYEFDPSFIVDVTDVWDQKIKSIFAYGSQFSNRKDTIQTIDTDDKTHKLIEARARTVGFKINATYGEAFKSVHSPMGVSDPFQLDPNVF